MKYNNRYHKMMQLEIKWKLGVEAEITQKVSNYLSRNQKKNLVIDNIVYGVVNDRISYCILTDYNKGYKTLYPIWDKECCGDGWFADFGRCCRIYDLINEYITETTKED